MKRILAIISRPPYSGSFLFETLEAAMVTQAFDFPTCILFRGGAVNALRAKQTASEAQRKLIGKVVTALSTYEIERVLVCRTSLQAFGLATTDLVIDVESVSEQQIQNLIGEHDVVLGG